MSLLLAVVLCAAHGEVFGDFIGSVLTITKGDTIAVKHDGITEVVHLFGVKVPAEPTEIAARALAATARLCQKKDVFVRVVGSIRYGEVLGLVTLPDQRRLDLLLLSDGYVRWDRLAAPDDVMLRNREELARKAGKGLWSATYREQAIEQEPPHLVGVDRLIQAVAGDAEQVYLVAFSLHYHRPRCPYLNLPGFPVMRAEAIKRGYTSCPVCGRYRVHQTLYGTGWQPVTTLPHRDSVQSSLPLPRLETAPASPHPTVRSRD